MSFGPIKPHKRPSDVQAEAMLILAQVVGLIVFAGFAVIAFYYGQPETWEGLK